VLGFPRREAFRFGHAQPATPIRVSPTTVTRPFGHGFGAKARCDRWCGRRSSTGSPGSAAFALSFSARVRHEAWAILYLFVFGIGGTVRDDAHHFRVAPRSAYSARSLSCGTHVGWVSGVVSVALGLFSLPGLVSSMGLFGGPIPRGIRPSEVT